MADPAREFDVVVHGATGFTGRLVCERLSGLSQPTRWAMAGRDLDKLANVSRQLGLSRDVALIRADAEDAASVRAMTLRTRALISTVGPYQLHGSSAVEACAETGTDYVDMTGEPVWMRDMLDAHASAAATSGARILFSCGFDSIPFDVGVHQLQRRCIARWGHPSSRIRCRVRALEGGISGGTAATRRATEAAILSRPEIPAMFDDPFLLTPGWRGADQPAADAVAHDPVIGRWTSPFYMAFINTKHVHRTNYLLGGMYGRDFRYDEAVVAEGGREAAEARAAFDPFEGRDAVRSGDGPSPEERAANRFDLVFLADGLGDERLCLSVSGEVDPGYEGTARMMVETVRCLAETPSLGGFWTPASLFGDTLARRLETHAGFRLTDEDPTTAFTTET